MTTSRPPQPKQPLTYPRGSVVQVRLGERAGREVGGERLAIVISSNMINEGDRMVVVVPMRPLRGRAKYTHETLIPKGQLGSITLPEDYVAVPVQIRSVDVKRRVAGGPLATVDRSCLSQIEMGLFAVLGGLP
jgi:mRNA-degrading endonuclease toxin of MazEF toxin-antitoxin module